MPVKNRKNTNSVAAKRTVEGSLWELILFALGFIAVFSMLSRANAQTSQTPATGTQATGVGASVRTTVPAPKPKKPNFEFGADFSVETYRTVGEEPTNSGSYILAPSMKYNPSDITFVGKFSYSREYNDGLDEEQQTAARGDWDNAELSLMKAWKLKSDILDSVSAGAVGVVPFSRESGRRSLLGATGPAVNLKKKIGPVAISQVFGYMYGVYEYQTREDGTVNTPDAWRAQTNIKVDLLESLKLDLLTKYTYGIPYYGDSRGAELSWAFLDFAATEMLSIQSGFVTERATKDGDGDQIKFWDPKTTAAFVAFTMSI